MAQTHTKVPIVTAHVYLIAVVLLLILSGFLALKYVHVKYETLMYAQGTVLHDQQFVDASVTEEAKIIAATVSQYPTTAPLYTQNTDLQNYVTSLSGMLQRDLVIVDPSGTILAATVPSEKGKAYVSQGGKLTMTLKDGISREFFNVSTDYPNGINEIAVVMRNAKGSIAGAVLLSTNIISR